MKLRLLPKSIERQLFDKPKKVHVSKARFETVLIDGKPTRINARLLPDDLPTQHDWYRIRVWNDELNGISLTG